MWKLFQSSKKSCEVHIVLGVSQNTIPPSSFTKTLPHNFIIIREKTPSFVYNYTSRRFYGHFMRNRHNQIFFNLYYYHSLRAHSNLGVCDSGSLFSSSVIGTCQFVSIKCFSSMCLSGQMMLGVASWLVVYRTW